MGSLARRLVPFALLAFAAAAPAQQRKPCFVTVVDVDDQPLAHAEVTLVELGHLGIDAPDVVRAFTDNRGRARPEVVVGRLYSASAMADAAADGSRLVSEPTDRGACGIVLELVAMYRATPRTLRLVDSETTKEHWSRGLHVLGPDGQSTLVLPVDAEGVATLPPSPWGPLQVGIRDANGALLEAVRVEAPVAAPTISFPKRTMLWLEITEPDGKHAAGATASVLRWTRFTDSLFGEAGPVLCPATARADASGLLDVPLGPWEAGKNGSAWLRVEKAFVGVLYMPTNAVEQQPSAPVLAVSLASTRIATGKLAGVRSKERAVAQLRLTLTHHAPRRHSSIVLPFDVDVAGNEMVAVLPSGITEHQLTIHLTPDDNTAMPRIAVLPPGRGDMTELPDVDLAKLRRFPLRLVDANGDASASAKVLVVPVPEIEMRGYQSHVITDLAGRAEVLVGDGDWGIYMVNGKDHAWLFVDSARAGGELEVKLEPIPVMTLRVLDADGKPVRGARLEPMPNLLGGMSMGMGDRAKKARDTIVGGCADRLATQARSNRAGQLAVPVQDWVEWYMTFRVRAGERLSAPFAIQPGADLGDVVVK